MLHFPHRERMQGFTVFVVLSLLTVTRAVVGSDEHRDFLLTGFAEAGCRSPSPPDRGLCDNYLHKLQEYHLHANCCKNLEISRAEVVACNQKLHDMASTATVTTVITNANDGGNIATGKGSAAGVSGTGNANYGGAKVAQAGSDHEITNANKGGNIATGEGSAAGVSGTGNANYGGAKVFRARSDDELAATISQFFDDKPGILDEVTNFVKKIRGLVKEL